jgi:hypothetical protein
MSVLFLFGLQCQEGEGDWLLGDGKNRANVEAFRLNFIYLPHEPCSNHSPLPGRGSLRIDILGPQNRAAIAC